MKSNKKKKHKPPTEKYSDYALLILAALLVFLITLAITSHSEDKYSGKTNGEVTDVFFIMPNKAGYWTRRVEVSVNGQIYKIHIDSPTSIQIGDNCKVRYRNKRPSDAYVEWY